jgi:hypothetical protein
MKRDDTPAPGRSEPTELKQPWQPPVIEFVNLKSSESDGGANFDGAAGSS